MSLRRYCGQRIENPVNNGEFYESSIVRYSIGDRTSVSIPVGLSFTVQNRPFINAEFESGAEQPGEQTGRILAMGVVIDSNGIEVIRFYPEFKGAIATQNDTNVTLYSSTVGDTLLAGDYDIITFEIGDPGNVAYGNGQICIVGEEVATPTPTPTATFIPTATPTATPVPTPTATPNPTPTPRPTTIPDNPVPKPIVPLGPQYTLTYSETSKGWPSFYSYNPDFMVGMNNFFYSFKGGDLYRHNTNELRNNYYGEQYNSSLTSVINELPIVTKLFKTINLQSDEPWTITLSTDIQGGGFISNEWFELKEGSWYADIKNTTQAPTIISNFASRSINGIGRCSGFSGLASARQFDFLSSPTIEIGSIISVGDFLYFNNEVSNTPHLAGQVTQVNINLKNNINNIVIDASINGAEDPTIGNPYVLSVKNNTAESYGLLGHFCRFQIVNKGPSPTELFAVQAEIMKSYP